MRVKLVFNDWQRMGKSVYRTPIGNKLSGGEFHSGTTFSGEIELTQEQSAEIRRAIILGYQPCFWISDAKEER